jgi:hypothetical protein
MNDELEPLGLPVPPAAEAPHTLSELVTQHPLVALAASAAMGAGVMALVAAASQSRAPATAPASPSSDAFAAELRSQLDKLLQRLSASRPAEAGREATHDLGAQAAQVIDKASEAAKQTFRRASAASWNATETVKAHPLLASVALGLAGAAVAALSASLKNASDRAD